MSDNQQLYVFIFEPNAQRWIVREYYSGAVWCECSCKENAAYTAKLLNSAIKETERVFGMALLKFQGSHA